MSLKPNRNFQFKTKVKLRAMADPVPIKCVVVGPPASGKSSMLVKLTTGEISSDYTPTVFDNYATCIKQGGKDYELRY